MYRGVQVGGDRHAGLQSALRRAPRQRRRDLLRQAVNTLQPLNVQRHGIRGGLLHLRRKLLRQPQQIAGRAGRGVKGGEHNGSPA